MKLNRADLMERVTSLMSAAVALLPILAVSAGGAYAEEQPVASDLRHIITALKIVTELERIACSHVTNTSGLASGRTPVIRGFR